MAKEYITETYTLAEIGDGVISKGQALRYFEKQHPEYTSAVITNFRVLHDSASVQITVSVRKKPVGVNPVVLDKSPAYGQKLLNPGYDELLEKYNALVIAHDKLLQYSKEADAIIANATGEKIDSEMEIDLSPEDAEDLKDAKGVIESAWKVPMPEVSEDV